MAKAQDGSTDDVLLCACASRPTSLLAWFQVVTHVANGLNTVIKRYRNCCHLNLRILRDHHIGINIYVGDVKLIANCLIFRLLVAKTCKLISGYCILL